MVAGAHKEGVEVELALGFLRWHDVLLDRVVEGWRGGLEVPASGYDGGPRVCARAGDGNT